MVKEISLTQGKVAIVDDDMYDELNKFKWFVNSCGYAARKVKVGLKQRTVLMHRVIANTPDGFDTDHRNGNGLINTRDNLRTCTNSENQYNKSKYANNTSGFKGVSWHKSTCKWQSNIQCRNKQIYIGLYDTAEEAARAYDSAAKELHGGFARLNFPD